MQSVRATPVPRAHVYCRWIHLSSSSGTGLSLTTPLIFLAYIEWQHGLRLKFGISPLERDLSTRENDHDEYCAHQNYEIHH